MSDELSISIVTPSYNQVRFIERTILSVRTQDVEPVEYAVIDGHSTDGTVEILKRYADRLWYVSEPDRGQADAVNKGLTLTSGDLIGWLNSDDVYYPGALRVVRDYFTEHPDVDLVYGEADHIDEHDRVLEPYYCEAWDPVRLRDVCFLCQPAVFFRRRVVERHGLLDARLDYCMDYEYWLRLAAGGARFAYLQQRLAGSRMYASNKTLSQRLKVHAEINDMLKRRLGAVPTRWLSNYAHVSLDERGIRREEGRRRYTAALAVTTWWAALRWNRHVSHATRGLTWAWIGEELRRPPEPSPPRRLPPRVGSSLRIGIDVSQTGSYKAGCGYLAVGMLEALRDVKTPHQFLLYPTFGDACWDPVGPQSTWHGPAPTFTRWAAFESRHAARAFWSTPDRDVEQALGNPDIVHSHSYFCPTNLTRARLVYTLYDLSFLVGPEWTTEANRQVCFQGVLNASLHADLILAISEATRRHFLEAFPHYPEERIAVVSPASRFADRHPVPRPVSCERLKPARFFLSVGTIEPRKNLSRLVAAYAAYATSCPDALALVLVGGNGWLMEGFDREIRALDIAGRVIRLGYVDDRTLQWLYQNCRAFLYPSLLEGFGLPVVEAFSQGAAVLTSDRSALPEVAGDAALLVDPTSVTALRDAIAQLACDEVLRLRLRSKATARAAQYSWGSAAERTLAMYERVVSMNRFAAEGDAIGYQLRPGAATL